MKGTADENTKPETGETTMVTFLAICGLVGMGVTGWVFHFINSQDEE